MSNVNNNFRRCPPDRTLSSKRVHTMTLLKALWLSGSGLALLTGLYAASGSDPRPLRDLPQSRAYDDIELARRLSGKRPNGFSAPDVSAASHRRASRGRVGFGGYRDWREGGTSWTQDYPRADRHFAQAMRRLTRIHVRSVEQPVNPDDGDDVYNWPWLVRRRNGRLDADRRAGAKLREYLLRGGFLMLDDFWGTAEWNRFMDSMKLVFPDREIVDIDDNDPIFHIVYDLDDRYQIPGQWALRRGHDVPGSDGADCRTGAASTTTRAA